MPKKLSQANSIFAYVGKRPKKNNKPVLFCLLNILAGGSCTSCSVNTQALRLPDIFFNPEQITYPVKKDAREMSLEVESGLVEALVKRLEELCPVQYSNTLEDDVQVFAAEKQDIVSNKSDSQVGHFWHQGESLPLAKKLAQDALQISLSTDSAERTTVLCVALRNSEQKVEKLAFHNHQCQITQHARKCARELGYNVIQQGQSHAEVQLLQFVSSKKRPGTGYTHLISMGCNRLHCQEYDKLLSILISKDYRRLTACVDYVLNRRILTTLHYADFDDQLRKRTIQTSSEYQISESSKKRRRRSAGSETNPPEDNMVHGANRQLADRSVLISEVADHNDVVYGESSVSNKTYDNFYMPSRYLSWLCRKLSLSTIRIAKNNTRYINPEDKRRFADPDWESYEQSEDYYIICP
ncbi:MAG: hypothetical protein AAFV97_01965 [Bacteroidota bacterium]